MAAEIYRKTAEKVIGELKKRNMEGFYCGTAEEAKALAISMIPAGSSVSWGGSTTVKQLGILDDLRGMGCGMIEYTAREKEVIGSPVFPRVAAADYFLMSTNAITLKGELINIDGASNRLSSLLHGPKHVVIIAGMNKLVRTLEDGFDRIQTSVCPVIAEKTERKTPCGLAGVCADCHTSDCMCCNIVITRHSRYTGRIKVILVGDMLGV